MIKNFRTYTKGSRRYNYYVHPESGERKRLPSSLSEAERIAKALNAEWERRQTEGYIQAQRSSGPPNVSELIDEFVKYYIPEKRLSEKARETQVYRSADFARHFKGMNANDIDTKLLYEYLRVKTDNAYIEYRPLLKEIFRYAMSTGLRESARGNPADHLLNKKRPKKKRQRHTIEGFKTVHAFAPGWLQDAMEIGLYTLQRRSDIQAMKREHVSLPNRSLTVLQAKTINYATPVHIAIRLEGKLFEAVRRCVLSSLECRCPYLIHYRPTETGIGSRPRPSRNKEHVYSVTPEMISRIFVKARDQSGAYAHLSYAERPTFHDIRALGIRMYEDQGFHADYINALSGHSDDRMRLHYASGHRLRDATPVAAELAVEL